MTAGKGDSDSVLALAQVARAFALNNCGGPLYKCVEAYLRAVYRKSGLVVDSKAMV